MDQIQNDLGIANRLLLALPQSSLRRIEPALEPIATKKGQVIDHVDGRIDYMYFVNRGLVSIIKTMRDGRSVEVGSVGIEGVTDSSALLGMDEAVLETMVQIPGMAFRTKRENLVQELAKDQDFRKLMLNYSRFAFGQMAQTAACNRLHSLVARCCRWLLIAHDSALSSSFPLTHEYLAMMLGMQRPGVSIAANLLRQSGLIDYSRGLVTIRDRAGLEDGACECYGTAKVELRKLFGNSPEPVKAPQRHL